MGRKVSGLAVLAVVAAMLCLVFTMTAFAGQTDNVLSEHIKEADGTTGQDTNSGSGVKTGHIQDGAITTPKIVTGAVTDDKISGTISGSKLGYHTHNGADVTSGTIGVGRLATYAGVRIVHKGSVDGVNTFNTITDALNSITDNSASNRYAVKVMPGTYDEAVTMKSYVDVVGSGQGNTILLYSPNTAAPVYWPAGVSDTALENLSTKCGQVWECLSLEGHGVIRNVTADGANVSDYGIYLWGNGHLEMYNSAVTGIRAMGIYLVGNSYLEMYNSKIEVIMTESETYEPFLIESHGVGVLIKDSIIEANIADRWAMGVYADNLTMDHTVIMINAPDGAYGVYGDNNTIRNSAITTTTNTDGNGNTGVEGRNVKIHNTTVVAAATSPNNNTFGVNSRTGGTAEVNNSVVSGTVLGMYNHGGNFKIGSSEISGGHNGTSGVDKVVNCHDGNYNPIPNL